MRVTAPVYTYEDLSVGMVVDILKDSHSGKLMRAKIVRLHKVKTEKFPLNKYPENSQPGGCDYATHDGPVYASLRTYSEDGEPLNEDCRPGGCVHVRFGNNVTKRVDFWAIRPVNPLQQLAEQA